MLKKGRGPRGRQGPRGTTGDPGVRGWPGVTGPAGPPGSANSADVETDVQILMFELQKLRTEFDELRQSLIGLLRPRPVSVVRMRKRFRERRGT